MTRIAIILAVMTVMTVPAKADHCAAYGYRQDCSTYWPRCVRVERYCRQWVRDETRVYGYSRREDEERPERRDQCWQGGDVDVLSTEHQTEDNAREAARKLWMAKVQWSVGGQYMDLDEAAHIRWRCGPSNAHDTASGRIAEAAGVLTGKGGQNVRCALWARPCKVERKADDTRGRK